MRRLRPGTIVLWGALTCLAGAFAQEARAQAAPLDFSAGKTPAQLFASDCTGAECHRRPQGLAKSRDQRSLANFLREHYTNSRESAAALARYLLGLPDDRTRAGRSDDGSPPRPPPAVRRDAPKPETAPPPRQMPRPAPKSGEAAKPAEAAPPARPAAGTAAGGAGAQGNREPAKPAASSLPQQPAVDASAAPAAVPTWREEIFD